MKLALASTIGLAAAVLAGCAQYAPAPGKAYAVNTATQGSTRMAGGCFRSHDIRNHTFGDGHTMYLDVPPKGVYRVTTRGSCLVGAVSSDPLIMRSPPGREYICRAIDLDLAVDKGGFGTPCIVDTITPMTKEEVAALPKKLRP